MISKFSPVSLDGLEFAPDPREAHHRLHLHLLQARNNLVPILRAVHLEPLLGLPSLQVFAIHFLLCQRALHAFDLFHEP